MIPKFLDQTISLNFKNRDTSKKSENSFLYRMEKYAVIVAGGAGLRMGSETPKQFLLLHGKPVLWHSVQAFQHAFSNIKIVLVVPEAHLQNEWIHVLCTADNVSAVTGGETRFSSVKNGLQQVPHHCVVFVHDGVRCLLSPNLIRRCYNQTIESGNAIPVVTATDSLRIEKEASHVVIDRQHIRMVQTPQTFLSNDLKDAFSQSYQNIFTDEATVMEAFGKPVFLIEGEYENIKITRPIDLIVAEAILKNRQS